MKKVLILGGGGMIGQKLAEQLSRDTPEDAVTLFDIGFHDDAHGTDNRVGTVTDAAAVDSLIAEKFDVIYHLASIVSGQAEADFDLGWNVNMGGMMNLMTALRREHDGSNGAYTPRIVFTSSIAVFGGPYPDSISDEFFCSPQGSYGAQKAICEQLLQDYTRKGFIDGVSLRLPTICVRPGLPNGAASSFFSGIIREPLSGQEAGLPVPDTVRHWFASPHAAVGFLQHAAGLRSEDIGMHRALSLPGICCTVAEQIEALRDFAGQKVVDLIKPAPDQAVMDLVKGWPQNFDATRAKALGFKAESSFSEIIQRYVNEDMPKAT